MRALTPFLFAALLCAAAQGPAAGAALPQAPAADHHQHLFSPDLAPLVGVEPVSAHDLVRMLDEAGIRRALVLSVAYTYGKAGRHLGDEYARVRAENDWNGAQAAQYPGRLRAFCSFNPLKDYALAELARCARDPRLRGGIKLHFGNSDVQLENAGHVARLRKVFAAADAHHMAIVVHLRASLSQQRPYGAVQARVFLERLLPMAPGVAVQVGHFAGAGPGYADADADAAMAVLAQAVSRHDPRTANLWFDVATLANGDLAPAEAALLVKRIRQVGVDRVLFGSDAPVGGNLHPREAWAAFRRLPLTEEEFARIATNVAPYLREPASQWRDDAAVRPR